MVKFDKKVIAGLRKGLEQHRNSETLGPNGHILYDAMADTVSSGGDFSALSTDPFSLPAACWRSSHPTVRAGLSALVSLEAILTWAENSKSSQTTNLVLGPLREGWFDIINWLEFSLPSKGPLPLERAYFRVSINLLRHLFRLKKHLADLLERSTQVHVWTMTLWCCLWLKKDDEEMIWDYGYWMARANEAISFMAKPIASTGKEDDYDHECVWEALAAVNHRSDRVHRFIILGITQFIDFTLNVSRRTREFFMRETLSGIQTQLEELNRFFVGMGVTRVRERDVAAVVDVAQKLHSLPGGNDVACFALDLLTSFWDWEHRSIAWSLKAGVFPLAASLWRRESKVSCDKRGTLIRLFFTLATWSAYLPVAIAFQRYRAGQSFETAGCLEEEYVKIFPQWVGAHEEMMKRCALVEEIFEPKCHNWRCPANGQLEGTRVKCCGCYKAYYCSEACQKQHWRMHRCFCSLIRRTADGRFTRIEPAIRTDRGYVKPREAHFIKVLAKKFIHECGQKILETIIDHQRETLPADDATCVVALCVRLDEVPPGVGIQLYPGHGKEDYDPSRSYEENTKIYVTAQLPPTRRQERPPPLVEVMVITMWELRDRAEHFKSCKDHAITRGSGDADQPSDLNLDLTLALLYSNWRCCSTMWKLDRRVVVVLRKVLDHREADAINYGPNQDIICQAIAGTLLSGGDFSALSTDPFSLPPSRWRHDDTSIARGMTALVSFEALLSYLELFDNPQAFSLVLDDLRNEWFDIINWLEFALPSKGPLPFHRAYFRICIYLIRHIFRLKTHLSDLLTMSTQVHAWAMTLWTSLWLTSVEATGAGDDYDHNAVWEALAAVGHKPYRIHRLVIKGITNFMDFMLRSPEFSRESFMRDTLNVIQMQLYELDRIFGEMDVTHVREGDVSALVAVARKLHSITDGNDVACSALALLVSFWEWERRSIVWSLKEGICPLAASLFRPEAKVSSERRVTLTKLFGMLASWTIYFPVAVAYHTYHGGETLRTAGVLEEPYVSSGWVAAHQQMRLRYETVEELLRPKCFNWRCPAKDRLEGARVKCCKCFDAYYCSETCQKQHWRMHKRFCSAIWSVKSPNGRMRRIDKPVLTDRSYAKPRDAHFAMLIAKDYVHEYAQTIIDDLVEVRREKLPTGAHDLVASVCVLFDEKAPRLEIGVTPVAGEDVRDPSLSAEDSTMISVSARLPATQRGKRASPVIEVMVLTLWELRDRAEHFRTCENHAACAARVQSRPPRCNQLESLGRRCESCLENWGPDEDPWSAPEALECRRGMY
ncbi:uncharacterized protein SCHCODRAFT_02496481 [Schizophyllum commune H4-8]|nr:uncharacterized protein SCHCODRAFT_02496481 [Schizophyllum commune H4-8]KAI5895753.1 hypothetical protein SCHCODRAFT_02496481 [Schizophyllum commune H4-8]